MRIIVPADRRAAVQDLLTGNDAVTPVVVLPGATVEPVGDPVFCDVVREGASAIIERLRDLGVERDDLVRRRPRLVHRALVVGFLAGVAGMPDAARSGLPLWTDTQLARRPVWWRFRR